MFRSEYICIFIFSAQPSKLQIMMSSWTSKHLELLVWNQSSNIIIWTKFAFHVQNFLYFLFWFVKLFLKSKKVKKSTVILNLPMCSNFQKDMVRWSEIGENNLRETFWLNVFTDQKGSNEENTCNWNLIFSK